MTKIRPETQLVHLGRNPTFTQKGVNPVIQRTSSVIFDSVEDKKHAVRNRANGVLMYGRRGTQTHFAFQEAMTELECGAGCVLYPSGAAAITNAIMSFINAGDHILVTGSAYDPTQNFCDKILTGLNVETNYFDPLIGDKIADLIRPNTKIVFLESPGSITMEVHDLPAIVKAVRQKSPEIIIMIDNTWAAGVLLKPLLFDVDISIQSATKYINGHSDGMLGLAVANQRCIETLRENSYLLGQTADPDTVYMAGRGLHTLPTRLKQHEANSLTVANWLVEHPSVAHVFHPALPSHPGHAVFKRDFSGCNGLFSFQLISRLSPKQFSDFLDHFSHFKMGYSWGGFESLILGYQTEDLLNMRQYDYQPDSGSFFRLHVGLEHPQDLIDDLQRAFERI
ncbi:cystathionine beta-lyase [Providencia alcalifaciens]|uniref:Cystathionine beta-lyase n=1 Tax=Providencia alcalifaciens DSM 30120 TaxID=520999 RepID=B6XA25_9GAMM|nr:MULTISPECIES: cystathionine beta-lyase [Providencia]ATG15042.1 cystathionine beta-lyase [Providencia alcalifaciens]EEB47578.1 cystathionine beta-lyase [Providencia alcalifaciens DSM 30120]MTC27134.1 cystathionine beta-lyase [Providencia alcalifaciens]MTC51720.1 cystathionine beta-lyase [Providencia alcalifaciens]SPY74306.1 Cystathionine beta-lyase metC [Providencia alcalifaciens]